MTTWTRLALLSGVALLAFAPHAEAKRYCDIFNNCWNEPDAQPHRVYRKRYRKPRVRGYIKRHRKPEVRGYIKRHSDEDRDVERNDDRTCKSLLTVIGDARPTLASAREDAEASFMRATRFKYGEAWMELTNAKDYQIRCARASITELVGQTMQRCELAARPCRQPMRKVDGK